MNVNKDYLRVNVDIWKNVRHSTVNGTSCFCGCVLPASQLLNASDWKHAPLRPRVIVYFYHDDPRLLPFATVLCSSFVGARYTTYHSPVAMSYKIQLKPECSFESASPSEIKLVKAMYGKDPAATFSDRYLNQEPLTKHQIKKAKALLMSGGRKCGKCGEVSDNHKKCARVRPFASIRWPRVLWYFEVQTCTLLLKGGRFDPIYLC